MADLKSEAGTLLAGLKEEVALYGRIGAVSTEELRLVKEAELEKATGVLARKQEMLAELGGIEDRIRPLKERWPEIRPVIPPEVQLSFQATLRELSEMLEKLIAVERETEEVLSGQIALVRKRTGPVLSEENVRKAYGVRPEGKRKD